MILPLVVVACATALQMPRRAARSAPRAAAAAVAPDAGAAAPPDALSAAHPLRVTIAGAGVGGLTLANALRGHDHVAVTVLERTDAFKRFGGPIQLASNAMAAFRELDAALYRDIEARFTWTGNLTNGIKDGLRDEWYAKFDLASPAARRGLPFTGVIDRPDLQEILLGGLADGVVANGRGVATYDVTPAGVVPVLDDGARAAPADVLVGADGIWSSVRATMRGAPARGAGSGAAYSGYTVFAGELAYASPDRGAVGYKVYIGPAQSLRRRPPPNSRGAPSREPPFRRRETARGDEPAGPGASVRDRRRSGDGKRRLGRRYFVITDIGNGRYQYFAFLARPPGSGRRGQAGRHRRLPQGHVRGLVAGHPRDPRRVDR